MTSYNQEFQNTPEFKNGTISSIKDKTSISPIKDKTSDNEHNYSMMRKIFNSYNNNRQNKFNDSSSYIQNKKMITTGRQRLNNNISFFTNNNHLEIKQAKRLLRSRGSGIPKKNIQ